MGSCISKCRPKKKVKKDCNCNIQDFSHVHDKLVISQAPKPIHNPVSPSPSAASTTFSSVSGANNSTSSGFSVASSLSSSSSCSSSVSVTKDRSFSNEFLWSCAKENPHIIGRQNVIKGSHEKSGMSNKVHPNRFDFPSPEKSTPLHVKQGIMEKPGGSTPKKRARANSPTMVRQKSFRKEPDKVSSSPTYHLPNRTLMRSPSPSRRFNGESFKDSSMNATKEIYSRKLAVPKANFVNPTSSSARKGSFRTLPSPNYDLTKKSTISKSRDTLINHEIGSDENEVGCENEASQDMETMLVEDINNPLIALDCFIFL